MLIFWQNKQYILKRSRFAFPLQKTILILFNYLLKYPLLSKWNILSFIFCEEGRKVPQLLHGRIGGYRITDSIFSLTGSLRGWKLKYAHLCIWWLLFFRNKYTVCSSRRSSSRTQPAAAACPAKGRVPVPLALPGYVHTPIADPHTVLFCFPMKS